MHSHHGSGAVNFGVSRDSGGVVTAPGNAGDKHDKKKRGSRPATAVAARIERGHFKRTAGSTACVSNHVDSRRTDGGSLPAAERTSTAARDGGDDTHKRKRKPRSASAEVDRHARTARADRSGRHTDQFDGDPMKYADWSF